MAVAEVRIGNRVYRAPYVHLIRPLTEEEEASLRQSVVEHGITHPIVVTEDDVVLDGYHRLRIARELGLAPSTIPTTVVPGLDENSRAALAITLNFSRRQLSSDDQRALVRRLRREFQWSFRQIEAATGIPKSTCLLWCEEGQEEQADLEGLGRFSTVQDWTVENLTKPTKTRGRDGKSRPSEQLDEDDRAVLVERARALRDAGATLEQIANDLGVAIGTVSSWLNRGARIQTTLSRASRVGAAVRDGVVIPQALARDIDVERAARRQLLDERARQRTEALRTTTQHGVGWTVYTGDFRTIGETIPDGSVDLILTDPPYDAESVSLYADLGKLAARVLVPGGSLIAYCGQHTLPDVLDALRRSLRYWWCLALVHERHYDRYHGKHVTNAWKPLVWFVRDGLGVDCDIIDLVQGSGADKSDHPWSQGVAELIPLIEQLTEPGMTVLDPLCGAGTTGLAAVMLGRRFIGIEIDPNAAERARQRIARFIGGGS
jgi:transcriptional regulator with XRE-family HTH domain